MVLNGGHCSRASRFSHEKLAEHGFSVLTPSRPGYDATPAELGRTAHAAAATLAALLDTLHIAKADIIGISAAGPTALALAQQYPEKIRKLVLESAITDTWDEAIKRRSRLLFGRWQGITWGVTKLALRLAPMLVMRAMMQELTTLAIGPVMERMTPDDLRFMRRMIATSHSGAGFMNDIEHQVDDLKGITAPVLVMYSPYDNVVAPRHAERVAAEVATCELYEIPADTHLIWIGKFADDVWQKRLLFLGS